MKWFRGSLLFKADETSFPLVVVCLLRILQCVVFKPFASCGVFCPDLHFDSACVPWEMCQAGVRRDIGKSCRECVRRDMCKRWCLQFNV